MTVLQKDHIVRVIPGNPGSPAIPAIPATPGYYTNVAVARPGNSGTLTPIPPETVVVDPPTADPEPYIDDQGIDTIFSYNHPAVQFQNWRPATWEEIATLFTGGQSFYSQRVRSTTRYYINEVGHAVPYRLLIHYPVSKCDVSLGILDININTPQLHVRLPYAGTSRLSNMALALINLNGTIAPYICIGNFPAPVTNPTYDFIVQTVLEGERFNVHEYYSCSYYRDTNGVGGTNSEYIEAI